MVTYLIQGITLGISAAVTPGPFQAYLLSQTMRQGWRRTLPTTLAPLISDGPIILLVVFILSRTPAWFLSGVQVAGGCFLLYLAYEAYRAFLAGPEARTDSAPPASLNLFKAALINASGPGPYIFWGILAGPIFLRGWRTSPPLGVSFMAGFYLTLIGGFSLFVILFATARRFGDRLNRMLIGLSALALLIFGFSQILDGLVSILS